MIWASFSRHSHDNSMLASLLVICCVISQIQSESQSKLKAVDTWSSIKQDGTRLQNVAVGRIIRSADPWHTGATTLQNAVFAARGQTVYIPCVPLMADELMDAEYIWTDKHASPLVDSRFVTKDTGDLEISDVQPEDTAVYECHVTHLVGEVIQEETHIHHLLEYALPNFNTEAVFVYDVKDACDQAAQEKEHAFRSALCPLVEQECVYSFSATCHVRREEVEPEVFEATHEMWISVIVHTDRSFRAPNCDPVCMKDAVKQNLEKNYLLVESLYDEEIRESSAASAVSMFNPTKFNSHFNHQCTAGYRHFGKMVCLPCEPGTYNNNSVSDVCTRCPHGKYQDKYAMMDCFSCPQSYNTTEVGATSAELCHEPALLPSMDDFAGLHTMMILTLSCGGLFVLSGLWVGIMYVLKLRKEKAQLRIQKRDEDLKDVHDSIRKSKRSSSQHLLLADEFKNVIDSILPEAGLVKEDTIPLYQMPENNTSNHQGDSKTHQESIPLLLQYHYADKIHHKEDSNSNMYQSLGNLPSKVSKSGSSRQAASVHGTDSVPSQCAPQPPQASTVGFRPVKRSSSRLSQSSDPYQHEPIQPAKNTEKDSAYEFPYLPPSNKPSHESTTSHTSSRVQEFTSSIIQASQNEIAPTADGGQQLRDKSSSSVNRRVSSSGSGYCSPSRDTEA